MSTIAGSTSESYGQAWSRSWSRVSDLAAVAQQALEERELARAEVHAHAVDRHQAAGLVQGDRAGRDRRTGDPGVRPPPSPEGPDARGQLLDRERLDQVVVGARVQAGDAVRHGVARREHEDRDHGAAGPQPAGDLEAGDVRQAHVEHDRVEAGRLRHLQGGAAVGRALDQVPLAAQQAGDEVGETRIVLDEQEVHGSCVPATDQRFLKAILTWL